MKINTIVNTFYHHFLGDVVTSYYSPVILTLTYRSTVQDLKWMILDHQSIYQRVASQPEEITVMIPYYNRPNQKCLILRDPNLVLSELHLDDDIGIYWHLSVHDVFHYQIVPVKQIPNQIGITVTDQNNCHCLEVRPEMTGNEVIHLIFKLRLFDIDSEESIIIVAPQCLNQSPDLTLEQLGLTSVTTHPSDNQRARNLYVTCKDTDNLTEFKLLNEQPETPSIFGILSEKLKYFFSKYNGL